MTGIVKRPDRPRERRPREKIAEQTGRIIDTALSMSTVYKGSVLFLARAIDVAAALDLSHGQLYRGGNFVHKVQAATGYDFLHDGVVLSTDKAGSLEPAPVIPESPTPLQLPSAHEQIALLASSLPRDELANTIGVLAAQLATRED